MQYLAIGAGAVIGANLRFLVANWAIARWGGAFPYGTFLVNLSGAFIIGVLLSLAADKIGGSGLWRLFFVTGFLGAYTTFSSYTWEALTLANQGAFLRAGLYVLGSNALGLLCVWLGAAAGSTFFS